jgi:hypothetical protein
MAIERCIRYWNERRALAAAGDIRDTEIANDGGT